MIRVTVLTTTLAMLWLTSFAAPKPKPMATLVRGYRSWTRVNPQPVQMAPMVAAKCIEPIGAQALTLHPDNPHGNRFITVWVNRSGRAAMMKQRTPRFPTGSIIVKEKLTSARSPSPELLTVMRKREKGYFPDGGDWEYATLSGDGARVFSQGRLKQCAACHTKLKQSGHIARTYLPGEILAKLR